MTTIDNTVEITFTAIKKKKSQLNDKNIDSQSESNSVLRA